MNPLDANVTNALKSGPGTAAQIAKIVGVTRREVNQALGRLNRAARVVADEAQPPTWRLAAQITNVMARAVEFAAIPKADDNHELLLYACAPVDLGTFYNVIRKLCGLGYKVAVASTNLTRPPEDLEVVADPRHFLCTNDNSVLVVLGPQPEQCGDVLAHVAADRAGRAFWLTSD